MTKGIEKVIENIANDVLTLAKTIVGEELSANKSSNKGILKNSALQNDIQVKVVEMQGQVVIETMFNNYLNYIEQGRKPRSGKQPPIDALREWALSAQPQRLSFRQLSSRHLKGTAAFIKETLTL